MVALCAAPPAAAQPLLLVGFDGGTVIYDGLAGDLDLTVNDQISFAGVYGSAGYFVQGLLLKDPPWPGGSSLTGLTAPVASLTLTNFSAEALSTSTIAGTLDVRFEGTFVGAYGASSAADVLTAEVGNSLSTPVPFNTDRLDYWTTGIIDGFSAVAIAPATGAPVPMGNPVHPGPGTTAYPITGHGPIATPAFTNPMVFGAFRIALGQVGDQFLLPSSAEVGFGIVVPEPSSVVLLCFGLVGFVLAARRRTMNTRSATLLTRLVCCIALALLAATSASAVVVTAPDNGFGTAEMPPTGEDYLGGQMQISAGLPPLSTIDINNPVYGNFSSVNEVPGGSFVGGTASPAYFADWVLPMSGTGVFLGYSRTITLPIQGEMHFGPRVGYAPIQLFPGDLRATQGQILGDPDFDLLRITAGTAFGMPSPGQTTLTDVGGGNWNVDSFFDITYRIDFIGRPGGPFAGYSGSTNGQARFQMGMPVPEPSAFVLAGLAAGCVALCRPRKNVIAPIS